MLTGKARSHEKSGIAFPEVPNVNSLVVLALPYISRLASSYVRDTRLFRSRRRGGARTAKQWTESWAAEIWLAFLPLVNCLYFISCYVCRVEYLVACYASGMELWWRHVRCGSR